MSRKDTIIVAVLINAGLLVILFVSSLKHEPTKALAKNQVNTTPAYVEKIVKKEVPIEKVQKDKVEKVHEQLNSHPKLAKASTQSVVEKKQPAPVAAVVEKKQPVPVQEKKIEAPVQESKTVAKVAKIEEFEKVIVKKGDFLEKIAKNNNTTVGAIMEKNNLRDSRLQIGQILLIPKSTEAPMKKEVSVPSESLYIVKEGDNLWKIAIENGVSVETLLKINKLSEKKAKMLRPGDKINLR